jgi:hypothetical protein
MNILEYITIDWIAIFIDLIGLWMIGNKNIYGFLIGGSSNILWFTFAYFSAHSNALAASSLLYLIFSIRNYFAWNKDTNPEPA